MTQELSPTTEEWHNLYAATAKIKAMAPWEFMEESDVFGVQNPETGELGFVSVMGSLGEHLAVAVYLGAEGIDNFWMMQEGYLQSVPELMFETPQLQASFEDRNYLTDKDRKLIKELGLKFRGRQSWPSFRSYRPGYMPWYLEAAEVRFLTAVLEQTALMAERVQKDPTLLEPEDEMRYLIRIPRQEGEAIIWEDEVQDIPDPSPKSLQIPMDVNMLTYLKQQPKTNQQIEVDFFWTPSQIQEERGERPFFGYNLLLTDHQSGFILGSQLCAPTPDYDDMIARIPEEFVKLLVKSRMRPGKLYVYPGVCSQLLSLVAQELDIRVLEVEFLPMLEEAKENLFSFL